MREIPGCTRIVAVFGPEVDDYIFHYTTRDAAFGHIIPERRLRLSPYRRMRDPLESKDPGCAYRG
jgi:hypothetical protein